MADGVAPFDATGLETVQVSFKRGAKEVSVSIEYPLNPPTAETDRALSSSKGEATREILCPGCSDQEVVLKMCHGCILADHIKQAHPERTAPIPRGMQNVYANERMIELIDNHRNVFVGRRPPRGVPTKKIGVKRTLRRSRYANPFVVAKKAFTPAESLEMYRLWVSGGYARLSEDQVQKAASTAPQMPSTLEEMLLLRPELFLSPFPQH